MRAMIIGHVIMDTPPQMKQLPHWKCLSTVVSEVAVKTHTVQAIYILHGKQLV